MPVRVLGCSGAVADRCRTTSFLVNDHVLVDAGTGVGDLTLAEMTHIDHILLTHSHLDHIAALPLLADAVLRHRMLHKRPPIQVYALQQTLDALRAHIFNDVIWPDFTQLPNPEHPVLEMHALRVGQRLQIGDLTAEALPAWHTVPTVGYAIWPDDPDCSACWAFTGDTGPNPLLWERLAKMDVQQLVIETAFGDEDATLARLSRHLHPRQLARELRSWRSCGDIFVTHIKPGEEATIMQAIQSLLPAHRVQQLSTGHLMPLGAKAVVQA
jgi:ribonuclease BN (tRNA processing enzyme)